MRIHITSVNGHTVYATIMGLKNPRFTLGGLYMTLPSIIVRNHGIEDIERVLNDMVHEGILRKVSDQTYERV